MTSGHLVPAAPRPRWRVWLPLCAGAVLIHLSGAFALPDLKALDAAYAVLRAIDARPVARDVVIVGVDDASFQAMPEPIALWHTHLRTLLEGIALGAPRAIGVDLELPGRSYDFVRKGLDEDLLLGLRAARSAAPTVIARGLDASGRVKPLHLPFLAEVGDGGSGLAAWPVDDDGRVRRFDEAMGEGGTRVETFVGALARRLGIEPAAGFVDFALGPRYDYLPVQRVVEWARQGDVGRLRGAFAERIVLVGSVLPYTDRHAAPVALAGWEPEDVGTMPGMLLHAQALRSLTEARLVVPAPAWVTFALLVTASLAWFALARLRSGSAIFLLGSAAVTGLALWWLALGTYLPIATVLGTAALAAAARVGHDAWFHRRERQRLKGAFEGYVSPNVLDLILRGDLDTDVGTGRRMLCVLFADIRDFTPLSERTEPERVVALLNRYFERMTRAIHRHDGTVDNFRGDGIMCFFGAPRPTSQPCLDGYLAATGMLAELDGLNADLTADGFEPIAMGISLACGEAVVGRIGAAARHEYTAIGDVANVSARIEGLTKEVGYPLVVSGDVADALAGQAVFDDLGVRALKGHAPVRICGWPPRKSGETRIAGGPT